MKTRIDSCGTKIDTEYLDMANHNDADCPVISIVHDKSRSYLWIGNNSKIDGRCFGTLSGKSKLRNLAKSILAAIGDK